MTSWKRAIGAGLLVVAAAAGAQTAEERLTLKGIALGQAVEGDCPTGSTVQTKKAKTLCKMEGAQTFGGHNALGIFMEVFEGKVISVLVVLPRGSSSSYGSVRDALAQKYGKPASSKSHLNQYVWDVGTDKLVFDGWRGSVLSMDLAAGNAADKRQADSAKSDL